MAATTVYGLDLAASTDLPEVDTYVSELDNLGYALARRLSTPTGALAEIGGAPDYGLDILQLLQLEQSPSQLRAFQDAIIDQCLRDERVDVADCSITLEDTRSVVRISIVTVVGEAFSLILSVNDVTVDILQINGNT